MFTLTRNVCILICNFNKEPFYGRRNAFEYCLKNYTNFPLTQKTYTSLELLKLLYDRGAYFEKSRENLFDYNEAIQEVHLLLLFAKNIFSSEYEINTITNKFYELKNISSFGYKERIILEKSLFSILKLAAGKEVTGFSRLEFQNLNFKFLNNKVRLRLILKIFELRRFLKDISSGNAYVRDITLENAGTNKTKVFAFVNLRLKSIKADLNKILTEK